MIKLLDNKLLANLAGLCCTGRAEKFMDTKSWDLQDKTQHHFKYIYFFILKNLSLLVLGEFNKNINIFIIKTYTLHWFIWG